MDVGVIVPQGYLQEYRGWAPDKAWDRTARLAQRAERLGFESLWMVDHLHTNPTSSDAPMFESFTALTALAVLTNRVRLGHLVVCAGFRDPGLVARMIATMDVISGGRMVLGIGAGWKEDEWRAYGYGFPSIEERLRALSDQLHVITSLLKSSEATMSGHNGSLPIAINFPRGLQQPSVPVLVGGNGPNVTWRLAARHADELNLDGLTPDQTRAAIPVIRSRCDEIGRDPTTLHVSVHVWADHLATEGQRRIDLLASYREAGISRVVGTPLSVVDQDDALDRFAEDAAASGARMGKR